MKRKHEEFSGRLTYADVLFDILMLIGIVMFLSLSVELYRLIDFDKFSTYIELTEVKKDNY